MRAGAFSFRLCAFNTAAGYAAAGRVIARDLHPAQPFRYDLLLPALREPSRVATRFPGLVEAQFEALLGT